MSLKNPSLYDLYHDDYAQESLTTTINNTSKEHIDTNALNKIVGGNNPDNIVMEGGNVDGIDGIDDALTKEMAETYLQSVALNKASQLSGGKKRKSKKRKSKKRKSKKRKSKKRKSKRKSKKKSKKRKS